MRHTEESIKRVKKSLAEMWLLVQGQVEKVSAALLERNRELALEVRSREKMVDAYELTVDRECENFFALLTPVAVDLRMMLSIVKINNNLERIGDFADGIAVFVVENLNDKITPELIERLELKRMFQETLCMLSLCKAALANEDSAMAGKALRQRQSGRPDQRRRDRRAGEHMSAHPDAIADCLHLHSAIRRIERIGDRCSNIAEDIVFYLEARVLKHHDTGPAEEK